MHECHRVWSHTDPSRFLTLRAFFYFLPTCSSTVMAPLADFLLTILPADVLPYHLSHYVAGKTPISTLPVVSAILASYLAVIFGTQEVMRERPPQKLNTLFRIHNAFLSLGSALLLALMLEEVASIWVKSGTYATMCNEASWTPVGPFQSLSSLAHLSQPLQRLEFYYMINYYFKYIELFDTVFLAMKKKPLGMCLRPRLGSPPLTVSTISLPACLPPLCNGFVMFHTIKWQDERCKSQPVTCPFHSSQCSMSVVGCHFPEPFGPRHYV